MADLDVFLGLLAGLLLLAYAAERRNLPHAVALVVGGLAMGLIPGTPDVRLSGELIFLLFLPPILYPSAYRFAAVDVRSHLRPVGFLAIGLVLVTTVAVAVAAHYAAGLSWETAFVLGAVLGPTDPVAATSIIRRLGAPQRITSILEGESLVNDGTGLSVLQIALGAVGVATFAAGPAVLQFLAIILGGAAVGAGLGWLSSHLRRPLDHPELEVVFSVLTAYGSFLVAERLHVSGILAVVLAGFVVGRRATRTTAAQTRMRSLAFWEPVEFLAESLLFALIGLQFSEALGAGDASRLGGLLAITALVAGVVVGVRLLWTLTVPFLLARVTAVGGRPGLGPAAPPRELAVLGVAGMRGAVSVAAALSIPVALAGGAPFPDRDTLLFVVFGTVVVTLVLPVLVLGPLTRRLGVTSGEEEERHDVHARLHIAQAALERAEELARSNEAPERALERVREAYQLRIAGLREPVSDGGAPGEADVAQASRRLRRRMLDAEREALARLSQRGEVTGDLLRAIEADLDLEEARLDS